MRNKNFLFLFVFILGIFLVSFIHAGKNNDGKKAILNKIDLEQFALEYEVQGSEYPVKINLRIFGSGKCSYTVKKPSYGKYSSSLDVYDYDIPQKDFAGFVDNILNQLKFFSLPSKMKENEPQKMDGATSFVTITYKGKTHKIGGYNAYGYFEYRLVFKTIRQLTETIEKNGKKTGLN